MGLWYIVKAGGGGGVGGMKYWPEDPTVDRHST